MSDIPSKNLLTNPMPEIGPPATHRGIPKANPKITDDLKYEGSPPPPYSNNVHGEIETLKSGVDVTHWFVESDGVKWHFVTAGNPSNQPVLFLHGLPDSWYSFHHQITAVSEKYYALSFDMLGYGQSDKRLTLDYTLPSMAENFTKLLDKLGIDSFHLVSHDRGSVLADNLTAVNGMHKRIKSYVRMQQSANEPHGDPKPPHDIFASEIGVALFKSEGSVWPYNKQSGYVTVDIPEDEFSRIKHEFLYEGVAEAVSKYFQTTNFDIELAARHDQLFGTMTMPVLFLQGICDPGQHPEEYENTADFVANGRVQFIDAGHFLHMEKPEAVSDAIISFISEH